MILRRLSTVRQATEQPSVRYDDVRRVTQVHESGRWVDSWLSKVIPKTKKADYETGEDQKGA